MGLPHLSGTIPGKFRLRLTAGAFDWFISINQYNLLFSFMNKRMAFPAFL
jgi:hypothetical protein